MHGADHVEAPSGHTVRQSLPGFTPRVFTVFEGLAAHQNREWFLGNKAAYEAEVRAPLGALVEALAFGFAAHDIPLTGDAKRSLFRVNRDIRFSNDKRPYKTNASAVLSRDGTKTGKGSSTCRSADPSERRSWRGFPRARATRHRRPAARHGRPSGPMGRDRSRVDRRRFALSREGALVRMPKGYEAFKDAPVAETLKLRNLTVSRPIPVARLYGPGCDRRHSHVRARGLAAPGVRLAGAGPVGRRVSVPQQFAPWLP